MGCAEACDLIKEKIRERKEKLAKQDDIDDEQTTDKYLRSLRRQARLQREEIEKETLKKRIAAFEKKRLREGLFGIKERKEKKKKIIEIRQKQQSFMGRGGFM